MIPSEPFKEAYFLEDCPKIQGGIENATCLCSGLISREKIDVGLERRFSNS